jgi:hypothetical protein
MRLPAHATPATSFPLDTADAATRGHRTLDAGGRTVDTWTLRRPHRTPVTWTGPVEHRTLAPDTGHRMPDTNADTMTTAQLASGPPWPPRERPHAEPPNRACALALPAGCSAAPPAKPRPGALLSSDDFGSSVERTAKLIRYGKCLRGADPGLSAGVTVGTGMAQAGFDDRLQSANDVLLARAFHACCTEVRPVRSSAVSHQGAQDAQRH